MADNNYCACNSGEGKYTIKLNQQGAAGRRGEQGEKGLAGYSPTITVVKDDESNYILRVSNENSSYNTPNLFPVDKVNSWGEQLSEQITEEISKLGENYVTTNTEQNITGRKIFRNVPIQTKWWDGKNKTEIDTAPLVSLISSYSSGELLFHDESLGKNSDTLLVYDKNIGICYNKFMLDGSLMASTENELATIGDIPTAATVDKLGLVKPDGTTITITEDGTITAVGGSGDVTLSGDNRFTGNNTFSGETTFNGHTQAIEQEVVNLNVTSLATMKNMNVSGTLTSNGEINAVAINAAGIKNNQNNKYYLNQGSITAGDNITIEETTDGVKVSATVIEIDDTTTADNKVYSSSKTQGLIDTLTTRLTTLEQTVGQQAATIATLQEQDTKLLELINTLKDRVTALETTIDGGNA